MGLYLWKDYGVREDKDANVYCLTNVLQIVIQIFLHYSNIKHSAKAQILTLYEERQELSREDWWSVGWSDEFLSPWGIFSGTQLSNLTLWMAKSLRNGIFAGQGWKPWKIKLLKINTLFKFFRKSLMSKRHIFLTVELEK